MKRATTGLMARLDTLRARHRQLDQQIEQEGGKPAPDTMALQRLKRLRLRAKDEMEALAGVVRLVDPARLETAA